MFRKTYKFTLTALIILFFGLNSLVQAAPPVQENTQNDSLGDSFNLDEEGNVIDEAEDSGGNNLGTIMSGKNDNDDEIEEPAEEEEPADETSDESSDEEDDELDDTTDEESGDGEVEDDTSDETTDEEDDGQEEDESSDDDATDEEDAEETGEVKQHPVAAAIAEYFDVPYEEVKGLHDDGYGFGNIAKAYFFSEKLNQMNMNIEGSTVLTPEDLLSEAHGSGWGNVLKENGIHPGAVGNGQGKKEMQAKQSGKSNKFGETEGDSISQFSGQGGGNGKGVGNGKNKDKGFSAKSSDDNGGDKGNGNGNKGGNGKGKGKGKNK
ncbi:MAG: hypothetical protein KDJ52_22220 [Anaerolineae bacterium]|nr:hypothetical protein [Anaerolineae bacterium]